MENIVIINLFDCGLVHLNQRCKRRKNKSKKEWNKTKHKKLHTKRGTSENFIVRILNDLKLQLPSHSVLCTEDINERQTHDSVGEKWPFYI